MLEGPIGKCPSKPEGIDFNMTFKLSDAHVERLLESTLTSASQKDLAAEQEAPSPDPPHPSKHPGFSHTIHNYTTTQNAK